MPPAAQQDDPPQPHAHSHDEVDDDQGEAMLTVYDNSSSNDENDNTKKQTSFSPLEMEYGEHDNYNDDNDDIYDYDDFDDDDDDDLESAALLMSDTYGGIQRSNSKYAKRPWAYKTVFQRWIQLAYLSLAAALSDWICFSTAACPEEFEDAFDKPGASANLIDLFLFTNVLACLSVTDVVAAVGLQKSFQTAVITMAIGAWLRSYAFSVDDKNYELFCLGTVLVGAAQPFFQCTPPLLSATWFAQDERARATAIALNFNQIGIAIAFVGGGIMGTTLKGLNWYFGLMALFCTITAGGTLWQFQNRPLVPPSASELEKRKNPPPEQPFYRSACQLVRTPGFLRALAAFICSIAITNIIGATIEELLNRGGVGKTWEVAVAGGGFEIAIVLGGVVLCKYVDKTKEYKKVTLWCLVASAICLLPLGMTNHKLGPEPWLVVTSLLALGFFVGPIQPINAELAVDVTYPDGDETAVESLQQIGGNLISALAMPVAIRAASLDWNLFTHIHIPAMVSDVRGDMVLLLVATIGTYMFFRRFEAPLKRSQADDGH